MVKSLRKHFLRKHFHYEQSMPDFLSNAKLCLTCETTMGYHDGNIKCAAVGHCLLYNIMLYDHGKPIYFTAC